MVARRKKQRNRKSKGTTRISVSHEDNFHVPDKLIIQLMVLGSLIYMFVQLYIIDVF